jgi:hypothetical protein
MPGSNQFDAQGRQEPRGKRRTPKKDRRNRRRSNGGSKPDSDKFHCPFNIRYPLSFKKGAYYKDSNAVQIQMKCWDTLRGDQPTEKKVTFYKLDFGRQNLRQIYLIVNDVLEKVMMWNATIPNERDLYKMAYETILEISEPTTIRDFNAYKRAFDQEHPEANRTARQRSGRYWFNWIFGSMISFKYGDDVAKNIHDYMNHLNGQDRGKNMNLPTLYNHLEHYSKVANTLRGVQDIEAGKRYTLHNEKMVRIFKQCLDSGELARWKRASLDEMPTTHREVTWPELKKNLRYVQSDEELARTLKGVDDPKGPEGWSSEEESSRKKSRKRSQPKEHQGRNWRQQAAHLKERNGYQDRYNKWNNPRPPSERFHARKPSYAKREDFKQAVKVAAAQMAAKRHFNPNFNPKAGTDSSQQRSAKRDHKQAFATEAEEDTPKDLDQPEEQDMSDAEFEKELDDIYDNFAAEQEQEPVSPDCQSDYESDMDTASSQSSDSESE